MIKGVKWDAQQKRLRPVFFYRLTPTPSGPLLSATHTIYEDEIVRICTPRTSVLSTFCEQPTRPLPVFRARWGRALSFIPGFISWRF